MNRDKLRGDLAAFRRQLLSIDGVFVAAGKALDEGGTAEQLADLLGKAEALLNTLDRALGAASFAVSQAAVEAQEARHRVFPVDTADDAFWAAQMICQAVETGWPVTPRNNVIPLRRQLELVSNNDGAA